MSDAHSRVVLVDDNFDIHDVVKRLIDQTDDIVLVGAALDGEGIVELCQRTKPDLVLMDVVLPDINGAQVTAELHAALPNIKILALSSYHEYQYIRAMLDSGATGYLVKGGLVQDLIATIRSTLKGNTVLSPQAAQAIFGDTSSDGTKNVFALTERELEVLKHLADGLTYGGIANVLTISTPTVRFHMNNILEKMNVETRSEALVLAAKNNLV